MPQFEHRPEADVFCAPGLQGDQNSMLSKWLAKANRVDIRYVACGVYA